MRRRTRPVLVTSAAKSREVQINDRRRRYLITMGVRTVLFLLAVFLFHGTWRFVAAAGALILPWLAVVIANAGPAPESTRPEYVQPPSAPELSPGSGDEAGAGQGSGRSG